MDDNCMQNGFRDYNRNMTAQVGFPLNASLVSATVCLPGTGPPPRFLQLWAGQRLPRPTLTVGHWSFLGEEG